MMMGGDGDCRERGAIVGRPQLETRMGERFTHA
jgi:hypothetical protein